MRSLLVRKKEETIIRAITALQSIELDIFNIFKQLPDVRIEDIKENNDLPDPDLGLESEVWGSAPIDKPRDLDEQSYSDEENRDYFEKKMKNTRGTYQQRMGYYTCCNTTRYNRTGAGERNQRRQQSYNINKYRAR